MYKKCKYCKTLAKECKASKNLAKKLARFAFSTGIANLVRIFQDIIYSRNFFAAKFFLI